MSLRRYTREVVANLTTEQIEALEEGEEGLGEANGSSVAPLRGITEVKQITIAYTGAAAGTKVTVEDVVSGVTIFSVTGNTGKTWRPVIAANAAVGGAASVLSEVSLLAERVRLSVEEADPGIVAKIDLVVREG